MLGAVISQSAVLPLFQEGEEIALGAWYIISFNSNNQPPAVDIKSFVQVKSLNSAQGHLACKLWSQDLHLDWL